MQVRLDVKALGFCEAPRCNVYFNKKLKVWVCLGSVLKDLLFTGLQISNFIFHSTILIMSATCMVLSASWGGMKVLRDENKKL